jgi:hypothetical protein
VQWLIHSNSNPTEINKGELAEPVALSNTPYDGQIVMLRAPCIRVLEAVLTNTKDKTMKAYKALVKFALANNATVSVWDGEEWQLKRSTGYQAIVDAINSVEIAELRIRDAEGKCIGWAQIIPDLEDDETLADYTMTPFMEQFEASQPA